MDTDEYTPEYPREQWDYLERGVMVRSGAAGLIHYTEPQPEMELVERGFGVAE